MLTVLGVMAVAVPLAGLSVPLAIVLGGALAMSTTAVAVQVMQERGEMGSKHGRSTFAVLLMQARCSTRCYSPPDGTSCFCG